MKKNKYKIFYLLTSDFWGGAQKYAADLSIYFHKNDYDVTVGFGNVDKNEKLIKLLRENGVKYHLFNHLSRNINIINDLQGLYEISKYIKKEQFDIVHANSSKAGFTGRLAARFAGTKKIYYTAHGWVFNEKINIFKRIFYQILETVAAFYTTKIFCLSKTEHDLALNKRITDKSKLKIVNLGIDIFNIKKSSQLTSKYDQKIKFWKKKNIIIGTVGNFFPAKNTTLLIEIAHQLINIENRDIKFIIIGDGKDKTKIQSQIGKYNLKKHILLTGFCDHPPAIMKYFDIFILTSTKEGFPYTLLEAGALKIPVISSNVGGVGEIIKNNHTGWLADNINKKGFIDKINQITQNKINTENISNNLYQLIIDQHVLPRTLRKYINYYNLK